MRLTLRTMLAYLDEILEPKDASELSTKIQESSFASDLVHRIRTSTRRLRLGAPKLTGQGMGLDPNTVAEYLDNTLPSDHVPDFEKVCLESDVHLAEVASCHQILTIVLGEPAAVDQPLRERMYRIGHEAVVSPGATAAPSVAPPPVPTGRDSGNGAATTESHASSSRPLPVNRPAPVASGVSVKSLALTLLCTFVVVVVALRAVGPFDRTHVVYRVLFGNRGVDAVAQNDIPSDEPPSSDTVPDDGMPADDVERGRGAPSGEAASGAGGKDGGVPSEIAPGGAVPAANSATRPASAAPDAVPPGTVPPVTPSPAAGAGVEPSGDGSAAVGSEKGLTSDSGSPTAGAATTPGTAPAVGPPTVANSDSPVREIPPTVTPGLTPTTVPGVGPGSVPAAEPSPVTPATSPLAETAPAAIPPASSDGELETAPSVVATAAIEVGRYVAEDQMLARYETATDGWYQVATASVLKAGDRLISFPTFRPHAVIGDINVTFVNATSVELMALGNEGQPQMKVHFGSAVILPFKAAAGRIGLRIGDQIGHVVFGDLDSVAAVRVSRYLPPGSDPETTVAKNVFRLYAVSGRVGWSEPDAKTIVVEAGRMLARVDGSPPSVVDAGPLPAWIEGTDQKEIERRASLELRRALEKDRPLSRSLMEMTDFRQHEVVDLACRSLSYLEVFDPLVNALSDKRQHYYWSDQFDELRSITARSPESAAALRRMFEKLHAGQAETLFRLTWGYSPAQLSAGSDAELVDLLEEDSMSLRVLAFMNLERITGGMTKNFRPELAPSQERTKVANWRRALNEGAIVYKALPTPWTSTEARPPAR